MYQLHTRQIFGVTSIFLFVFHFGCVIFAVHSTKAEGFRVLPVSIESAPFLRVLCVIVITNRAVVIELEHWLMLFNTRNKDLTRIECNYIKRCQCACVVCNRKFTRGNSRCDRKIIILYKLHYRIPPKYSKNSEYLQTIYLVNLLLRKLAKPPFKSTILLTQ